MEGSIIASAANVIGCGLAAPLASAADLQQALHS